MVYSVQRLKMEIIVLRGKTRHGKNRLKQHGDRWVVRDRTERDLGSKFAVPVQASAPWLWIETTDCECPTCEKWGQDGRWISEQNDPNFEILRGETNGS